MSHLMTKPTKWLCTQRRLRSAWFLHVDSGEWSDWADAQADLSLCWAHMPFCCFVMRWLICLALHKWELGKQRRSRSGTTTCGVWYAAASDQGLLCLLTGISTQNKVHYIITSRWQAYVIYIPANPTFKIGVCRGMNYFFILCISDVFEFAFIFNVISCNL